MPSVSYVVIATLPDQATAAEYIGWLEDGHVDAVIRGGAHAGMIVRIQDPSEPIQIETRYVFSTRALLDRYLQETAPRLRADGNARFGPRGVTFTRRIGEIL